MPLPELTPEQLEQLNAISGLGKTRKRKDAPSGDNLPDVAPADLMQTALQQDDNAGFEPFSLPERTPDMDNEVYEGLIKESLQQQLPKMKNMKKIFLLISVILFIFPVQAQHTLRLMTYNIKNANGMDDICSFQRVANVINNASPDVVAIQCTCFHNNANDG